jgi:hypothetical protein
MMTALRLWHSTVRRIAAALIAACVAPACAHAGLLGSQVTGTEYFPDLSTVFAGPAGPVTVGPGIEFPSGALATDGNIDISNTQILWQPTQSLTYLPGAFNGFKLTFAGAPTITSVTLDGATTLVPVGFSFTGSEVLFNLEGLTATIGEATIFDVQTAAAAEPASLALLGMGLVGLAVACRRRGAR